MHLCLMPEGQAATGASMYAMLGSILSALDPMWTENVVGINTDGVTGVSAGLANWWKVLLVSVTTCGAEATSLIFASRPPEVP
jgi:hypothetical protein